MKNIKEKGFECIIENNTQVVDSVVEKLISENSGIEMTIELDKLENQDYQFFMKLVEFFKEEDIDIEGFSESELWNLVENINGMGKDDIEISLDKLELYGLLKYEYGEDDNEELCYVIWIEGIDNYDNFSEITENRKTS